MAVRPICILPDPVLRQKSCPVKNPDSSIPVLVRDMFDTMYEAQGVGLAAIQIGVPLRIVVVDMTGEHKERLPFILINPEITERSEELSTYEEGCLSIPGCSGEISRPARICVKFIDEHAKEQEMVAESLLATCLQHEIDHLNGILFIDYLSKLKRDTIMRKFKKRAAKNSAPLITAS